MDEFEVVDIVATDWNRLREIRLEMLADSPTAFGESLVAARAADESDWRLRVARMLAPRGRGVAAVSNDGRWLGTMRGALDAKRDGTPFLYGVYVTPSARGRTAGVADALLDRIEDWAHGLGRPALHLHVVMGNDRARLFYERRGYDAVGEHVDPADGRAELEMRRLL